VLKRRHITLEPVALLEAFAHFEFMELIYHFLEELKQIIPSMILISKAPLHWN
jgi:hypothetical protein